MFRYTITWTMPPRPDRPPTIYEALKTKLGREPTNAELRADVERILDNSTVKLAEAGKLPRQRKR